MVHRSYGYSYFTANVCPSLDAPANGTVTLSGNSYGSVATYQCDFRFEMTPSINTRNCSADGRWTGIAPICKGII